MRLSDEMKVYRDTALANVSFTLARAMWKAHAYIVRVAYRAERRLANLPPNRPAPMKGIRGILMAGILWYKTKVVEPWTDWSVKS